MAVECRNGRPNRTRAKRAARTGVVALLALGAGVGCGQTMLRPGAGPGLAAQSLGQVNADIPGRRLSWEEPGPASGRPARGAKAGPTALAGLKPVGPVSLDGMTAGPSPSLATFDGSTYARTTWNGWKLPEPKLFGAAAGPVLASSGGGGGTRTAAPKPASPAATAATAPGFRLVDDSLLEACRTAKIAPPTRRVAVRSATGAAGAPAPPGLDGLAAACREAKIAPPKVKTAGDRPGPRGEPSGAGLVPVPVAAGPPIPTPAPAPDAVGPSPEASPATAGVTLPAPTGAPQAVVDAALEPRPAGVGGPVKEASPARGEATELPLLSPTPTEVQARAEAALAAPSPAPAEAPKRAATESLQSEAALPDRRPVRLPRRSHSSESLEAPLTLPTRAVDPQGAESGQGGTPPLPDETSRVTTVETPGRPEQPAAEVAEAAPTLDEALRVTNIDPPKRPDEDTAPAPAESDAVVVTAGGLPTPEEASRVTEIELPKRPGGAEPSPEEASRVTEIELPKRPEPAAAGERSGEADLAVTDPRLKEASEATEIPPPIPARLPE